MEFIYYFYQNTPLAIQVFVETPALTDVEVSDTQKLTLELEF